MTESDRVAFADLMGAVYTFYRQKLPDVSMSMWWEGLQRFELEEVRAAFNSHAFDPDRGQFLPMPADVVRHLGGSTNDQAAIAAAKVLRAIQDVGSWESVAFDDPIIHQALTDVGGWTWYAAQTDKEFPHAERRFKDAYRAYVRRGLPIGAHLITHLPGHFEIRNTNGGYAVSKPKLVGVRERALLIAEGKLEIKDGWQLMLSRIGREKLLTRQG